ncbi:DUF6538 domain-containing protein [Vibrio gazogenes]|uniref:DUF6538 domain-containing protein n=1 Tax=Vibrio gazogenes TaxID=687 RepID=UPI0009FA4878
MTTNNFLYLNRFHTFYFRQRTPLDILSVIPSAKKELKISLKTKCRASAMIAAREHKVMFDCLFTEIRESVARMESMRASFQELDGATQRQLMLKQRATEAINDQQFTQQLFFLLERKNRIKYAFDGFYPYFTDTSIKRHTMPKRSVYDQAKKIFCRIQTRSRCADSATGCQLSSDSIRYRHQS